MTERKISKIVVRRLPRYMRYLRELEKKGVSKVSSKELSELMGHTASQIRQDLNNFGGFGQQGYGYSVENLHNEIRSILGLDREYRVVVVGFGRLGQAIANYLKKNEPSFNIVGIFDIKDNVQGAEFPGAEMLTCKSLKSFVDEKNVDIAVITVPMEKAQIVADTVCEAGVKGIWNLTSVDLEIPEDVAVENVHMSDSLHSLAYFLNEKENGR